MLVEDGTQLVQPVCDVVVLGNAAAHAHHVGERPVRDALPVGEAASAVPVDRLGDPVEVLVELPPEPRLPDAGDAGHRQKPRLALVRAGVEEVLDRAQLAVASYERRLEAVRFQRPAQTGHDAQCPPQRREALFALQLERARLLEDNCVLGRAAGRLADVHGAGRRARLDARRGVDEIAGNHALSLGADRDGRFAREHAGTGAKLVGAHLVAERGDRGDQVECCAHCALGVVLGRGRRPPHGHDGVADELLDGPAVHADDPPADVEVAREELAHLLGVARLGQRSEAHEVGEEDGDEAPLCRRLRPDDGRRLGRERSAAVAAERVVRLVGGAAARACKGERRAAAGAELPARPVLGGAGGAHHRPRV